MDHLSFAWDSSKNESNQDKHGISFEEAQTVFFDDMAMQFFDPKHATDEDRFLLLGQSFSMRTLMVCHCYREHDEVIRIISARKATAKERQVYLRNKS